MATLVAARTAKLRADEVHPPLARLAGPLALTAGALIIVQQLVMVSFYDRSQLAATMAHPLFVPVTVIYFVNFCVLLVALVAVYQWQAHRAGAFGALGFVAALVGTLFLAGDQWFEAFAVPWIADVAPQALSMPSGILVYGAFTSYVLFAVGWVLFGIASLRARAVPRAICVAIIVGGVIGYSALVPPYAIPLGLAFAWLGAWLLRTTPAGAHADSATG